jgi:pantothenate kinase
LFRTSRIPEVDRNSSFPEGSAPAIDQLVRRLQTLAAGRPRVVVGIVGAPGAGKSTFAAQLADALGSEAVQVPMDGFHLANAELERLGLRDRKGAPETFDAGGFVALLRRLRTADEPCVYAPAFDRQLEEPVAGSIPVDQGIRYVLVEGNYLLLPEQPWCRTREFLDEVWYLELPEPVRLDRLLARHRRFGRSEQEASAWAQTVDQPNAELIAATASEADLRIPVS